MSTPDAADLLSEFRQAASVPGPSDIVYRTAMRRGKLFMESVRGNAVLESHELIYAIGSGVHGRSYAITRGDQLFLAPLSYYSAKSAWDLSPGYASGAYRDFLRPVTDSCLFCHTASAPPSRSELAISCERCHGPGGDHVRRPPSAIVNPAKLPAGPRGDVCYQCHLGGDIRIPREGRTEWDFRPGGRLESVIAIFSVPSAMKPEGLDAVGQVTQLRMSRCWQMSQGRLACITCHDPHNEPAGARAVSYYRRRCLTCHESRPCTAPLRVRNASRPPDNCIACHMPRSSLTRIAHVAHTNHRILRRTEEALDPTITSAAGFDLTYENGASPEEKPDLRSEALAYAEAVRGLAGFSIRARQLLNRAMAAAPGDADLVAAAALLLPDGEQRRNSLARALELGARSAEVRLALCDAFAAAGQPQTAAARCEEAISVAPFDPAPYLRLMRIYLESGDRERARQVSERLREFDPANPQADALLGPRGH